MAIHGIQSMFVQIEQAMMGMRGVVIFLLHPQ